MTAPPKAQIHDNAAWEAAQSSGMSTLSVLIPFLRDDPIDLVDRLSAEAPLLNSAAEAVILDDGTADPALTQRLKARIDASALPIRLITLTANEGRSIGRNRLASAARAGFLLFLDSDMRPDRPDFLAAWLSLIATDGPAVAFGGFSLDQAPDEPRFGVHRAMAARSECVPAARRALAPEKYVYTSNLLVRRDVFETETFDPGFRGWGWEDVEWAMRVSRKYAIAHPDIPATHMGLDTTAQLAGKYEQSAGNFARVVSRHPEIVAAYPSYKVAKLLKRLPALSVWRPMMKRAALAEWLPVKARSFSLRLYRAALYAEAV